MLQKIILFLLVPVSLLSQLQTNFEGITFSGEKPPDPVIAVGYNHVVLAVNSKLSIFDKSGNFVSEQSFIDFFNSVSPQPAGRIFDPKLAYDHSEDRFILLALSRNPSNRFLLAVSQTDDPTGSWYTYSIDHGSVYSLDYPGLGFDENTIVLTSHTLGTGFHLPEVTILKKSEVYNNNINYQKNFSDFQPSAEKIKPARVISSPELENFYLVDTKTSSEIRIWKITDPLNSNSADISVETTIDLGEYNEPVDAEQKGGDILIDVTLAGHSISDIVVKDGTLYGAYTVKNSTNDGDMIKYFSFDLLKNELELNGRIEDPGVYYYYPVIHPDKANNLVLVFNKSSSNDYVGVAYKRILAEDSEQTPVRWLKPGDDYYTAILGEKYRWGDYSGIAIDPENNMKIWTYGEWAKTSNEWSTWVGEIDNSFEKDVTFKNEYEDDENELNDLGGTITVNNTEINSGESEPLLMGIDYQAYTNNERFINWDETGLNLKHNNWDGENTEWFLEYNFEANPNKLKHQARFKKLNYAKVEIFHEDTDQLNDGDISFNDPWYVKNDGTQHHPDTPTDLYWIESTNGFYEPNGKFGASDKGVFLEQGYEAGGDWTEPYYKVKVASPQDITLNNRTHKFYFQNWEAENGKTEFKTPNSKETAVAFMDPGATAKAVMKGSQITNNTNAFANTNQRKVVEDHSGT